MHGPTRSTDNSKNIPVVTIDYENIDKGKVVREIRSKLPNIQSRHPSEVFLNKSVILSK